MREPGQDPPSSTFDPFPESQELIEQLVAAGVDRPYARKLDAHRHDAEVLIEIAIVLGVDPSVISLPTEGA